MKKEERFYVVQLDGESENKAISNAITNHCWRFDSIDEARIRAGLWTTEDLIPNVIEVCISTCVMPPAKRRAKR